MATYIFGEGPTGDQSGNHKDTFLRTPVADAASYATDAAVNINGPIARVALYQFDISAVAEEISTATLTLYVAGSPAMAATISAHNMLTDWGVTSTTEGASENPATGGQATYDNAKDFNGAGGDVGWSDGLDAGFSSNDYAAAESSQLVGAGTAQFTAVSWDVSIMAEGWRTGNNYGVVMISDTDQMNSFWTQNYATAAYRPILTVVTGGGASTPSPHKRIFPVGSDIGIGL